MYCNKNIASVSTTELEMMDCFLLTTLPTISTVIREESLSLVPKEKAAVSSQHMPCNFETEGTVEVTYIDFIDSAFH